MNKEKYVFSQFISFLNEDKFRRIVDKYHGNRYVKHFTCWNQLLTLMFGQLSNRESLRDLIVALEAHHSKCYHLGMGKNVLKSSLAKANQDRDYHTLKNTHTTWLVKHDKSVLIIFSNLVVTFMLSIRQLLTCVFQSFGGLNSARRKRVSKYIHYMM